MAKPVGPTTSVAGSVRSPNPLATTVERTSSSAEAKIHPDVQSGHRAPVGPWPGWATVPFRTLDTKISAPAHVLITVRSRDR